MSYRQSWACANICVNTSKFCHFLQHHYFMLKPFVSILFHDTAVLHQRLFLSMSCCQCLDTYMLFFINAVLCWVCWQHFASISICFEAVWINVKTVLCECCYCVKVVFVSMQLFINVFFMPWQFCVNAILNKCRAESTTSFCVTFWINAMLSQPHFVSTQFWINAMLSQRSFD